MKTLTELLNEFAFRKQEYKTNINESLSKIEFETCFDKLLYDLCAISSKYANIITEGLHLNDIVNDITDKITSKLSEIDVTKQNKIKFVFDNISDKAFFNKLNLTLYITSDNDIYSTYENATLDNLVDCKFKTVNVEISIPIISDHKLALYTISEKLSDELTHCYDDYKRIFNNAEKSLIKYKGKPAYGFALSELKRIYNLNYNSDEEMLEQFATEIASKIVYYSDTSERKAFFAEFRKFLLNRKDEFNSGLYSFDKIYKTLLTNTRFKEYKYITELLNNLNSIDNELKHKIVNHYNRITNKSYSFSELINFWKPTSKQTTNDISKMIMDILSSEHKISTH